MKILIQTAETLLTACMAIILFSCSSKDVSDNEAPKLPFLQVEQGRYEVSADVQTFEVQVNTNVQVNISVLTGDRWISVTPDGHSEDVLIYKVSVSENKEGVQREGSVAFMPVAGTAIPKDSHMGPNTIVVVQKAAEP